MRKWHRALALFFSPFLVVSAATGLLWAYAPYLYLKQQPMPEKITLRAASATLYDETGKAVHTVTLPAAKDVTVDEYGIVFKKYQKQTSTLHQWVTTLHKLEFFGLKKELTIIPGAGLLLMLVTGLFLFKRGLR